MAHFKLAKLYNFTLVSITQVHEVEQPAQTPINAADLNRVRREPADPIKSKSDNFIIPNRWFNHSLQV